MTPERLAEIWTLADTCCPKTRELLAYVDELRAELRRKDEALRQARQALEVQPANNCDLVNDCYDDCCHHAAEMRKEALEAIAALSSPIPAPSPESERDTLRAQLAQKDQALRVIAAKRWEPSEFGSQRESVRRAVYELNRHRTIARAALSPSLSEPREYSIRWERGDHANSPWCSLAPGHAGQCLEIFWPPEAPEPVHMLADSKVSMCEPGQRETDESTTKHPPVPPSQK